MVEPPVEYVGVRYRSTRVDLSHKQVRCVFGQSRGVCVLSLFRLYLVPVFDSKLNGHTYPFLFIALNKS